MARLDEMSDSIFSSECRVPEAMIRKRCGNTATFRFEKFAGARDAPGFFLSRKSAASLPIKPPSADFARARAKNL